MGLLLLWFAVQRVFGLTGHARGGSIAIRAHIGGFLTGMLPVPLLKRLGLPVAAKF